MTKFKFNYFLAVLICAILPSVSSAQQLQPHFDKCIADVLYQEQIAANPAFATAQAKLEQETNLFVPQYIAQKQAASGQKNASVVRIIPVVFHVIHEGGPENVSRAQLVDQIDSLNKDYRRLNADAVNTPAVYQSIGADSEIEFRLATLDPNGNCTDGVVRVVSSLTNNARDNVKALSYWPSNKYLNIWVVKSIENTSGASGIIVGFAQFPGGTATTDGVVLKYDFTGSIGAAANSGNYGRTATHEVGHWLNLRHIWGDANCGSDFVTDTPTQQGPNQSNCPAWPHITCNNGPNGDLFTDYMDYTNGSCQNIFSVGQAARMNAALSSTTSNRNNLWSTANLIATGTNTTSGSVCAPIATFLNNTRYICEGTTVNFADGSWNATPTSWAWDFPGGTPSTSTSQNPSIQYNTAGTYDVTLTASNATGSDTYTQNASVIVFSATGQYTVPYNEGFESITFPGSEWIIDNQGGNTFVQSSTATHTGFNAVSLQNYTGNPTNTTDILITPTYNLTNVTNSTMTFWLAFAARSASSTDQLKVFASTTCGQLWNIRYNKTGTALSTAGIINSNFIPTAAQWRQETVNIASSSYNNKPNVRFKFEYLQNTGNNLYIDDINLDGTVGLNEVKEDALNFSVYPNPVISHATVEFTLTEKNPVIIDVVDVLGRVVNSIASTTLDAGDYQFELPSNLSSGLYNVRINVNGFVSARKVLIN